MTNLRPRLYNNLMIGSDNLFFGKSTSGVEYIIAGLGNPGADYENTRHNAGFRFIDWLCNKNGVSANRLKHMSLCTRAVIGGHSVLIMKPQTYMNNSGESIADAAKFYKIAPANILVVSDDISLEPGKMRLRKSGSAGGHNGLKSIIEFLKTDEFPRLKIGVGQKPNGEYDLADWVLGKMSRDELGQVAAKYERLEQAVITYMDGNFEKAVQTANSNQ